MAVEIENKQTNSQNQIPESNTTTTTQTNTQTPRTTQPSTSGVNRKIKKSTKRRTSDVKHVSRKLIMAWKLASEHQNITWKEVAPIIDSVEFLSSHWKSDERLKSIEPVAVDIVSQVNKIHLELNLRVFGMNRLRIITEEFLNLLKQERDAFIKDLKEKEKAKNEELEAETNQENLIPADNKSEVTTLSSVESNNEVKNKKSSSRITRTPEELLDRLLNSLSQLYKLLNDPSPSTSSDSTPSISPKPSLVSIPPPPKPKQKKRNIFSGFFSSSDKKQSSSNNSSSSTLVNSENRPGSPSGLDLYKNNIFSEWQEYTRKFVEPNYLFKVCKSYLAAYPNAIPSKASLIGQNWICIANEISVSLWNILKKKEDDLASSLIFLTLYKHGSQEIIERAISTIGSQLPHHFYVRLEYALKIKEFDQFTKEEQLMLDGNYVPEYQQPQPPPPPSPIQHTTHKKSYQDLNSKNSSSKKDKKKKTIDDDDDEPLSFADMLAM